MEGGADLSYHIGLIRTLRGMFLPFSTISELALLTLTAVTVLMAARTYYSRGTKAFRTYILTTCFVPFILVVALLFIAAPELGAGWRLQKDVLSIKAPPVTATLELPSTSVVLVSSSGPWEPVVMTNGTGTRNLATGEFTLRSHKSAVVFSYRPADRMLLLESRGKYYLIDYPGVQDLYKLILAAQSKLECQWILRCQSGNGFLTMGNGDSEIDPYFINLTEMALVTDPQYLGGVKKYLEWYLSHLNHPDNLGLEGTIYNYRVVEGVVKSVHSYDSADSYAATFLSLVAAYYRSSGDADFIYAHFRELSTVAGSITALQGINGLVWTKPDYHIYDLMDNCEDYRGLKDWSSLLASLGYKSQSELYDNKANLIKNGILEHLWDDDTKTFAWAVDDQGKKFLLSAGQSYPGLFAQIYPVTFDVIAPTNPKAALAYKELNKELPQWSKLKIGDPLPWSILGYASAKMGDLSRTGLFLKNCHSTYIMDNHKYPWSTFESGFYVRASEILQKNISEATGSAG